MEKDIQSIELEDILFLKNNNVRESVFLEYKLKYTKDIGKEICAFMNSEGGWIIIGVEDENEMIKEIIGTKKDFIQDLRVNLTNFDPIPSFSLEDCVKIINITATKKIFILKIISTSHSVKFNGIHYMRFSSQSIPFKKDSEILEIRKIKGEVDKYGREIKRFRKLIKKNYTEFIGRKERYDEVITELQGHHYIISIDGIGGVGKSTLALEIAFNAFEQRFFDSVLWFSGKKEKFIFSQITQSQPDFTNLEELLISIANELNIDNFEKFTFQNKIEEIIDYLKQNSILLILDNLETIDLNTQFIEFLAKIKGKSKVLITSRKRIGQLERIINLEEFNLEDTINFIEVEAESRSFLILEPKESIYKLIYELTEGIPLAIKMMIGWLMNDVDLSSIKEKLEKTEGNILDFCFHHTFHTILSGDAKKLFCVFSLLPNSINKEELRACVDFGKKILESAISELITNSLIIMDEDFVNDKYENYFKMLPLTKLYGEHNLSNYPNLKRTTLKNYNNYLQQKRKDEFALDSLTPEKKLAGLEGKDREAYVLALQAREIYESGDAVSAILQFQRAEKISDNVPELYFLWGSIEMNLGHIRKTNEIFKRATSLEPKNPTYWLTWMNFHRTRKDIKSAQEVFQDAIKVLSPRNVHMLKREFGIALSLANNFGLSLNILKSNMIQNATSRNKKFLNAKTLRSILHTYIHHAAHERRRRAIDKQRNLLSTAIQYYDGNKHLVAADDDGIIWRLKRIYLSLANSYMYKDFELANNYFSKAYYKQPENDDRALEQNNNYFLRDWQRFVNYWIKKGKNNQDFTDILEGDSKGRFD